MMDKLHMDSAPFLRHPDTTKSLMSDVLLMLVALSVWSVFRNGLRAAVILALCVGFCCLFDWFCTKLLHYPGTVRDLSGAVTGAILAAGMPSVVPLWLCLPGALLAVLCFKHIGGGGLGKNRVNPAAAALLVLHLCFKTSMNTHPEVGIVPFPFAIRFDFVPKAQTALDAVSQGQIPPFDTQELLLGTDPGPLLYTPSLLILLCALFLFVRHTADARPALSCLAVSAVMSFFSAPGTFSLDYMAAYLMSGGLLFACAFMLTDPTTIPATNRGRWLFGALVAVLNYWLSRLIDPMTALYAALCLGNLLSPVLEYLTLPTPFGKGRRSVEPTGQRHRDYVMEFSALIRDRKKKVEQVRQSHAQSRSDASGLCARVLCGGTSRFCSQRYVYDGAHNCASVTLVGGGSKSCFRACEGFGDCVRACKKGAIRLIDGIAAVDRARCDGCGDCLEACPKRIITLVPARSRYWVGCLSPDDPLSTKKHCLAGCVGCHRCEKVCPTGAIAVDGHIAHIRYELCISCGACAKECPRKCIWEIQ